MHNKNLIARIAAALAVVSAVALPMAASAQSWNNHQTQQHQEQVRRQHEQEARLRAARERDARNRRIHNRQAQERREDAHQRALRLSNERLRRERNAANARADRWRYDANHRRIITRRPVYVQPRTYVTYRPEIIYRTPPSTRYRYVYVDRQPRWYPGPPPNEWRSIANISGGLAILGLLANDNRLVFAGTLGALYSYNQYEQDRYSRVPAYRLRYTYFSRPFIYRNGYRYDRVTVYQGGHRYYRFARR